MAHRPLIAFLLCGLAVSFAPAGFTRDDLTPLLEATRTFDSATALALVRDGADVNATETDGTTALHWAAFAGDAELVRALLDADADPNATNRYGVAPLQVAADSGHAATIATLLAAGADANATTPEGEPVLMTAARTGEPAAVEALLAHGADISAREAWYGETALIWAAIEDHADVIELLAANGADIDAQSYRMEYERRRAGQSILPLGEWTALMYAARQNALDAGARLIEVGADLDIVDADGATALVIAIINAHYEFAQMLLEADADPNIVDNDAKMGPLYAAVDMHTLAVGHGRGNPIQVGLLTSVDIARSLLAHGADPNAKLAQPIMQRQHTFGDSTLGDGATPLLRAAKSGDIEMLDVLLAGGADPMAKLPNGTTALMFAAGRGWRNGSPLAPSYDQGTEADAVATIDRLLELGLDLNASNDDGDTALHAAIAGRGSEVIIRHLIDLGADLSAANAKEQTPLELAEARGMDAIAELIRGQ